MDNKLTRSRFLKVASAGTAWIALTNALGCKPAERTKRAMPSTGTSPVQLERRVVQDLPPAAPRQGAWTFRTRPDLSPRAVDVAKQSLETAPGYVFVAPKKSGPGQGGPMIVDKRREVVWFSPVDSEDPRAMDFKVQTYRGESVLTWGEASSKSLTSRVARCSSSGTASTTLTSKRPTLVRQRIFMFVPASPTSTSTP